MFMVMKKFFIVVALAAGVGSLFFSVDFRAMGDRGSSEMVISGQKELVCRGCNLIMVSLSNVSAEHMSLYGYERLTTPRLDEWAKDAVVFENTFTQSSWTLPVGVSLFTALYPYSHGMMNRLSDNVLNEKIQTLPEILRSNGYHTAAFTGGLDYAQAFGHMRGFDEIDEVGKDSNWPTDFAGFKNSFQKASSWIRTHSKDNFFVFLHGYDAHCPFVPPEKFKNVFSQAQRGSAVDPTLCVRGYRSGDSGEYETYYFRDGQRRVTLNEDDIKYLQALYDEEILSVDDLLVEFLQGIDSQILEKTVVVIFSDHGEMFAKHGRFGRAGTIRGTLYDDVLHIPLVMKVPGFEGKRIDGLAQVVDVMPTLLSVLDVPYKSFNMDGQDLSSLIKGTKMNVNEYVFAGSKFKVDPIDFVYKEESLNESIRDKKWKLIHEIVFDKGGTNKVKTETYELYDIVHDSDELKNLIFEEKEAAERLKARLRDWSNTARQTPSAGTTELSDDFMSEARKRGYW